MNSKQPAPNMGAGRFGTSEPVSRVLSFKTAIYLGTALPLHSSHLLNAAGPAFVRFHGVAPDRVYSDEQFPVIGRALISAFPPLPRRYKLHVTPCTTSGTGHSFRYISSPHKNLRFCGGPIMGTRRYISVALFLKSPSAGVTRYPCPTEPGLSSWTAFRPAHAAVQLTCSMIVLQLCMIVKWEFMRYNDLMSFYSYEEREATVHAINSMGLFEFTQG